MNMQQNKKVDIPALKLAQSSRGVKHPARQHRPPLQCPAEFLFANSQTNKDVQQKLSTLSESGGQTNILVLVPFDFEQKFDLSDLCVQQKTTLSPNTWEGRPGAL